MQNVFKNHIYYNLTYEELHIMSVLVIPINERRKKAESLCQEKGEIEYSYKSKLEDSLKNYLENIKNYFYCLVLGR